ncbi:MAG: S8 family serine peptidase [Gemmataceae bacterium]|nr:S8 family serine peptidase [Gemmataceae bacterium]
MNDVFAAIRALVTTDRLVHDARATGEGIAVAVIDSGIEAGVIHARHPDCQPIRGGVFVGPHAPPLPYDGKQSMPHGTTVADIILTLAPRAQLYSADVFGPAGTCEVETIVRALQWATEVWHCKVVNLSLGVAETHLPQLPRQQRFLRAIEDAYFKDVLVVAAAHNDHPLTRSYPALFAPPLVSVDKNLFPAPWHIAYAPRAQVEFQAHGRGYLGPFAQEPATSWAAPHVTGVAARILSLQPDLKPFEMKTILYWLAQSR